MYENFITYSQNIITSLAAISNSPINLSYPLDTTLALTLDNFCSILLPFPPPPSSCSFPWWLYSKHGGLWTRYRHSKLSKCHIREELLASSRIGLIPDGILYIQIFTCNSDEENQESPSVMKARSFKMKNSQFLSFTHLSQGD